MSYSEYNHTFMICAYGENQYLENCILSVLNQTVCGIVKISTSTPNHHIKRLAQKYNLEIIVNTGNDEMTDNWNFAFEQANTNLVTLCHQDDYFLSNYLEKILIALNNVKNPIMVYTDYFEDRMGKRVEENTILKIKRLLNFPMQFSFVQKNSWIRSRILSLGNPICCPSVTFNKDLIISPPFSGEYKSSCDWETWIRLFALNGRIVYCNERLVAHRISEGSTTSATIANGIRRKEDYEIFCKFWPKSVAQALFQVYSWAEKSNKL